MSVWQGRCPDCGNDYTIAGLPVEFASATCCDAVFELERVAD